MSVVDCVAVVLYFAVVVSVGVAQSRRAARSMQSYFLGERRIPWLLLALSGAISNFDLTGTMWMVSVLHSLGLQSWWQHWMWGVTLPAFGMVYMARWVRRSGAMTGADWMRTRFGDDVGAQAARYSYALAAVLFTVGSVAYALRGMIKFAGFYLESYVSRYPIFAIEGVVDVNLAILVSLAALFVTAGYVLVGGLYSVIAADAVQGVVLIAASLAVAVVAFIHASPAAMAECVPGDFTQLAPQWQLSGWRLEARPDQALFGWCVIAWVSKGVLMNAGGPAQIYDFQRYLAASTPRDASKLAAAWALFLAPRWSLVMGITLLAMTHSLSVADSEQILPAILSFHLPVGLRGIVFAGFASAFMTSLAATINSGASYLVVDLIRPLSRRELSDSASVKLSYFATLIIVGMGAMIGLVNSSIDSIWTWLQMTFVSGLVIPNLLRWYWWRLNGWGYAVGVATGSLFALIALGFSSLPDYLLFAAMTCTSTFATILATLLTPATPRAVLADFYRVVRPFGFWGEIAAMAKRTELDEKSDEPTGWMTLFNLAVAIVAVSSLYLLMMLIVGRWYLQTSVCLGTLVVSAAVLKKSWYDALPVD